ncbi:carbamoyltransferase [Candidatus Pelagibacter sp.]|nr:carbamoyltransferase [Candidatus Pelagibacter sp.]
MKILGISCFYHDSAASLIDNGEIINCVQEERFSRIKHDSNFPSNSIKFILEENNLKLNDIDSIVYYEKPFIKFERLIETYLHYIPRGFESFKNALPIWMKEKLFQKLIIRNLLKDIDKTYSKKNIFFSKHHYSHAASAFFPSPFDEALVVTFDGVGEWETTSVYLGKKNNLIPVKVINYPNSLGLLYSAFTYFCGFKVNSGEYKLMGLAPYGDPKYAKLIKDNLINIKEDGSFRLNDKYFNYSVGLTMTNKKFSTLFNIKPRKSSSKIDQIYMDLAASIQIVLEEVVLKMIKGLFKEYKIENLCLAGGVALNCVANGKIYKERLFKNIWIQPASGDAGGALGAALGFYYEKLKNNRKINPLDSMKNSYLGPQFSNPKIKNSLEKLNATFEFYEDNEIINLTAKYLSEGKVIGWFQDKMEYGPRALGNRSILADPSVPEMQKKLNLKIKFREGFRPFAPIILEDKIKDWFEEKIISPYMLVVDNLKKEKRIISSKQEMGLKKLNVPRSVVQAITHVDFSARIQTVNNLNNSKLFKLLNKFNEIKNIPILINTSFNVRGEPIVCTPLDAFRCFMATDMDILVLQNYVLIKENQGENSNDKNYINNFPMD